MLKTVADLSEIGIILKPVFIQNNVKRAAVFGSYARGEQKDDSDMDFVVDFADGASLLDLGGLFEDLSEATGRKVDILTYHSLMREPNDFAANVMNEIKVIYEAD